MTQYCGTLVETGALVMPRWEACGSGGQYLGNKTFVDAELAGLEMAVQATKKYVSIRLSLSLFSDTRPASGSWAPSKLTTNT